MSAGSRRAAVSEELRPFVVLDARLTGVELGVGSYGSVEEADIRGTRCVAKKLHEALLPPPTDAHGADRMIATFVAECCLMSVVRHPNIVQFLGVFYPAGARLPALLMERLLTDLHGFLERNHDAPLTMKRSILIDVAKGLTYLHTRQPAIIHRDLTARNVLLNSAMVAKIADLGNSRIVNVRPGQLMTMTKTPGNMYYMPPEAQEDHSRYDASIDVFSFGNLTLFTLTNVFPEVKAATFIDESRRGRVVARTEVQRRIESFNRLTQMLGTQHQLVLLAENCLQTDPRDRPSIATVLQRLESCTLLLYRSWEGNKLEMVAEISQNEREILTLQQQTRAQRGEIEAAQTEVQELQQAKEDHEETIETLQGQNEMKQRQNETLVQNIEAQRREILAKEESKREQQNHIEMMESKVLSLHQISQAKELTIQHQTEEISSEQQSHAVQTAQLQAQLTLKEEELEEVKLNTSSQLQDQQSYAVLTAQLRVRLTLKEEELEDVRRRTSAQLQAQRDESSWQHALKEREIFVLKTELEDVRRRTSSQQQAQRDKMSRQHKLVTSLEAQLRAQIVNATAATQQKTLPTSFEWRRCRGTPVDVWNATTVVMNGRAYIGCTTWGAPHVLEYTPESDEWVELPEPPVEDFGFAVLNNQLVLVGGIEPFTERQTNNIAVFEPSTRQWVQAYPPMPTARSHPSAIVYQHYLIVAGGEDYYEKSLSTVEVLDSVNKKWYSAEQVPIECYRMIPVVISDTAYLLGGWSDGKRTKAVPAVSLPALINKVTSQPQEVNTPNSWKMLPDSPLYRSTPFTSHGMLLTAGGEDESGKESSHIYCYDPVTNQWEKVGDLPNPRYGCSCAVLPSTELLVVGGAPRTNWTSVYKATIQWK